MKTTRLFLVRHGETEWNREKRMQGHLNSPLTEKGIEQAKKLGEKLSDYSFDFCYTSDSQRAVETAYLVTEFLDIPISKRANLREIAMGIWEGQTQEDIKEKDEDTWYKFWEEPHLFKGENGGETFQTLEKRVSFELEQLLTTHVDQSILIVSHRLTIKTMIALLQGKTLLELAELDDVKPNSLSILDIHNQQAETILYSDISHYEEVTNTSVTYPQLPTAIRSLLSPRANQQIHL